MTPKEIEAQVIEHMKGMTTLDENFKYLQANYLESKKANSEIFGELRRSISKNKAVAADLKLRLALAEKEVADLKTLLERGRGFRSTLTITFISAIVSSICSATVAYYVRPR